MISPLEDETIFNGKKHSTDCLWNDNPFSYRPQNVHNGTH